MKFNLEQRVDDSEDLRQAIALMEFASKGVRDSDVQKLADRLEGAKFGASSVHEILKKTSNNSERMNLLLEMSKRAAWSADKSALGYVSALRDEIEATPSPLTTAEELQRLGLPSP